MSDSMCYIHMPVNDCSFFKALKTGKMPSMPKRGMGRRASVGIPTSPRLEQNSDIDGSADSPVGAPLHVDASVRFRLKLITRYLLVIAMSEIRMNCILRIVWKSPLHMMLGILCLSQTLFPLLLQLRLSQCHLPLLHLPIARLCWIHCYAALRMYVRLQSQPHPKK